MPKNQPDTFPVPVTGQEIPRGWFARLVAFMNSLILRGDGEYLLVNRTNAGTTIRPSTKLIDLLSTRSGAPAASGGSAANGIQASVSGGTASVTLTGGTGSVNLVQGSNVSITGSTNGDVVIASTAWGPPDYSAPIEHLDTSTGRDMMSEDISAMSGHGQSMSSWISVP